ncbi:MAG: YciI family protein [Gemmatimonadota bacterium]
MRFMMLMIPAGYEDADADAVRDLDPDDVAAMIEYNEELEEAGVLRALDGLHPPSMGARVSFAEGEPRVTDGPFTEATEVVGGYWIIEVGSKEEAVEWAKRCPASENEVIEIRRVQEIEDYSDEVKDVVERSTLG